MNGVDVSGVGSAVSSQTDVWWFILPFVAAMAVIALLKLAMMLSPEKAEVRIRALVSEQYQVEYPLSTPLPGRGGSIEVTIEGKDDGSGVMKVYENTIVKRSEDNIVTLWVPKTEGATEFVELGSDADASEYELKD